MQQDLIEHINLLSTARDPICYSAIDREFNIILSDPIINYTVIYI